MSANQEAKKLVIEEIKQNISNAKSIVLVDYRGITVAEDTVLRKECRNNNAVYKVYKNRLFQKACEELGITGFDAYLEGTTAFAFGMEDETCAPRVIKAQNKYSAVFYYEKEKNFATVKGSVDTILDFCNRMAVNGEVVDKAQVERLASIPSKEQLIANLLAMLNAPVSALARAIQAIADKQN